MGTRTIVIAAIAIATSAVGVAIATQLPQFHPSTTTPPAAMDGEDGPVTPRAEVQIDARRQQLIGVRTVATRHTTLAPEIRVAGTVTYDETRQTEINTRVDGWIRELRADFTGRAISRGEPLFTIYSPDLIATQNEFLLALRGTATSAGTDDPTQRYAERLVEAARDRLLRLDMTAEEIDRLTQTGRPLETITFRSPASGVIVEKTAVRGMRAMAGQTLFKVADLSAVWVEAEVSERDLANVRIGTRATVSVPAYPDRQFVGTVSYIASVVEPETRTIRTRIALANPRGLLKPNMVATVTLRSVESHVLVVPTDAVVDTGTQQLVFLAEGDGRFVPRDVQLGRRAGGEVEILAGLELGDEVAASATFFLDSESQLRGALQDYQPAVQSTATAAHAATLTVTFRPDPDPPRTGELSLVVTVKDADGRPVSDADVSISLFMPPMPSMNMPAMKDHVKLVATGNGEYRGSGQLIMAGRWDVTVRVDRGGHTVATQQFGMAAKS